MKHDPTNKELLGLLAEAQNRADKYFKKCMYVYEQGIKAYVLMLVVIIAGFITFEIVTNSLERDINFHKLANDMLVRENADQAKVINMQRDRILVLEGE